MTIVVAVLCFFIAALGALGVVAPGRLLGVVRSSQTPAGLYAVAALRVVLGVALLFAAPSSRAPEVLPILGVVIFVAGLITPVFGLERYRKLLTWRSERGPAFIRGWAAFAFAFSLLLLYAVAP